MTSNRKKIRVLIADDSKGRRAAFREAIRSSPFEIEFLEAEDGVEMVELFNANEPALVFADLETVHQSGVEAIGLIRERSGRAYLVVAAGQLADDHAVYLQSQRVDEILAKPVKPADLVKVMERFGRNQRSTINVLIADDSLTVREMLRNFCRSPAHDVAITEAADGVAALNLFTRADFDLVFLDVHMPGMDGTEVLGRIKEIDKRCKVVMLTSDTTEKTVRAAISRGADSYVVKPFSRDNIQKVMAKVL